MQLGSIAKQKAPLGPCERNLVRISPCPNLAEPICAKARVRRVIPWRRPKQLMRSGAAHVTFSSSLRACSVGEPSSP